MVKTRNIKLFPIYKLFAYDLLFYYAISMLFLVQVKHIPVATIVLLNAIYSGYQMICQLPVTFIVDKIGYKRSMIIGNISCTLGMLFYIISTNIYGLTFCDFLVAFGFAIKGVSESPFIYTVMKKDGLKEQVSIIEAKGSSLYFYFEAGACIVSGYLYLISPYLPVIFCMLSMLTATILSFLFDDSKIKKSKNESSSSDTLNDVKTGFKFIIHSSRLKAIFLYASIFAGISAIAVNFSKAYLTDLKVSSNVFGIIFFGLNIVSAIGSALQEKIQNKRKNKTLAYICIITTFVFLINGIAYIIGFKNIILLVIAIFVFVIQNFFKGNYRIIIKRYLNNFTTSAIRSKIMSIYYFVETLGIAISLLFASKLLSITNIGISYIVCGVLSLISMIIVLDYMRPRLGLKPEDYDEKDIKYMQQ